MLIKFNEYMHHEWEESELAAETLHLTIEEFESKGLWWCGWPFDEIKLGCEANTETGAIKLIAINDIAIEPVQIQAEIF